MLLQRRRSLPRTLNADADVVQALLLQQLLGNKSIFVVLQKAE